MRFYVLAVITGLALWVAGPVLFVPIMVIAAMAAVVLAALPGKPENTWDRLERERRNGLHGEAEQARAHARYNKEMGL